jgi:catechol 2,3-dioxygenase-like lactoylglutathione lyase family enzyme
MTKLTYAIVFVSDMARSVAFYQDIIGLPLKHQSPGWSELPEKAADWPFGSPEPAGHSLARSMTSLLGIVTPDSSSKTSMRSPRR